VFDNIVSYIFFAIILALINSRVGIIPKAVANFKLDKLIVAQVVTPIVAVVLVAGIYHFHLPGMRAASDVIDAFRAETPEQSLADFNRALSRNSFAEQEITEQLAQQAIGVVRNNEIPAAVRENFATTSEAALLRLAENKPGDARVHVFMGSYYRSMNQLDKAEEQMALAQKFTPEKQAIIIQQGFVALSQGKNDEAKEFFQVAFELDKRNLEAREYYAAALFYADDAAGSLALMNSDEDSVSDEDILRRFAKSDFLISSANQFEQTDFLITLFEHRISPDSITADQKQWRVDAQSWATLAFLYHQIGNDEKAIATLEESKVLIPSFEVKASCIVENIEEGRDPQLDC